MLKYRETMKLTPENIERASEMFYVACKEIGMEKKEAISQRLTFENVLMLWAERFEGKKEFEMVSYTRFSSHYILLQCGGSYANPFSEEKEGSYEDTIYRLVTNPPEFYHSAGTNHVVFKLKRPEMNPMLRLALIFTGSILAGLLGMWFLPENILNGLTEYVVSPIYSKFLETFGCIAGPLIFLSVAWGIYGIGDTATFSRLGKSVMGEYVLCQLLVCVLCVHCFPLFGLSVTSVATDASQLSGLLQMILDIFPSNMFIPFTEGNTLQIIVLAAIMGIAMLYLGKRSNSVARAVNQTNNIVNFILNAICKLIPGFIVLLVINLMWSGSFKVLGSVWQFVVIEFVAHIVISIVFLAVTAINLKASPFLIFKKLVPTTLIALSTASSAATFSTMDRDCDEKLGIARSLSGFGIPLGIVIQKVSACISYMLALFFVAQASGTSISVGWLIMGVLVSLFTAIATPPIPGGGSIAYTMLFTQMGLPLDYVGIMLALTVALDFYHTAVDMFITPLILLNVGNRYGLVDRKVFLAKD